MFTDRVVLKLYAGKGGNGIVAWRREKYVPKGGPAGGNGGKGADIIFKANPQLLSLEDYRSKRIIKAENGKAGGPNNQQGKRGKEYGQDRYNRRRINGPFSRISSRKKRMFRL